MTTDPPPPNGLPCPACGLVLPAGLDPCPRCGRPARSAPTVTGIQATGPYRAGPAPTTPGSPAPPLRGSWPLGAEQDATTRYLCAAAHLDPAYGRSVIAEYLVEPTRAVPPSPGVDPVAVLREAVAARHRAKLRDGVLTVLLLVFLFLNPPLTVLWLIAAVSATVVLGRQQAEPGSGRGQQRTVLVLALLAGLAVASVVVLAGVPYLLLGLGLRGSVDGLIGGFVVGLLIVAVLLVDELVVHELARGRFRSGRFTADPDRLPPGWERSVRTLGVSSFGERLERVAAAERMRVGGRDLADVIVHRGWNPFLGAGVPVRDETLALPLEPADEDDGDGPVEPRPFTASDLEEHVVASVAELRRSGSLSPGHRFAGLTVRDQVLVPADRLVRNLAAPPVPGVLVDLEMPPAMHLGADFARRMADAPPEAARHYRCFRIEAWERDLVMSCYFAASTDQKTLYLEWTHCVLLPPREAFRSIDRPARTGPVLRGLLEAVRLPASAPARVVNLCHWFGRIRQRPGEVVPDRYGADLGLRELAADTASYSYLQDADAIRYIQIVEQVIFRAVSKFLSERGYSVVDVLEAARSNIVNNMTIQGGTFNNSAVGIGRTTQRTTDGKRRPPTQGKRGES